MKSPNGFVHKKSLGQHFLTSDVVPNWMADAADLHGGETVVEIGPGTGALTRVLLERGTQVIALEADERAIAVLREEFEDEIAVGNLVLKHTDVRTLDISTLTQISDRSYKVVANIPYYLSGRLFRIFLESTIQPNTLVFLVQKEVAARIARDPKESILSLSVKAFGTPQYYQTVSPGHFHPKPAVDSAIIAVRDISRDRFTTFSPEAFFTLVHHGLKAKRKQLMGNLRDQYPSDQLIHSFSTLGIDPTVRGEDVPLENWLQLAAQLLPPT